MRRNPDGVYKFEELSDRAKKKAIKNYKNSFHSVVNSKMDRHWFADYAQFRIDELNEELQKYGIEIAGHIYGGLDCYWFVSFSKGSGLAFETNWFYPWDYIKKTKQTKKYSTLVNAYKKTELSKSEDVYVAGKVEEPERNLFFASFFWIPRQFSVSLDTDIKIVLDDSTAAKKLRIKNIEAQAEEVLEEMFEFCKDKMRETHKELKQAYLHVASDEWISHMLIDFEYKFNEDGDIV